jgi:L-threonylcarbamoyladenylate synthase
MSEPSLVIRQSMRTAQGRLAPGDLTQIREILQAGGFVLLPSDTAYSIATWPLAAETGRRINELLGREASEPMSVAVGSREAVSAWSAPNPAADHLLKCFTPGPITVVRTASRLVPESVTRDVLGGQNHSVGTRVPDSVVEREVAGVGQHPVTTVPVRDLTLPKPPPVTAFEPALAIVRSRSDAFGGAPWGAIEGDPPPYPKTSTVVVLYDSGEIKEIKRHGVITEAEIRACLAELAR